MLLPYWEWNRVTSCEQELKASHGVACGFVCGKTTGGRDRCGASGQEFFEKNECAMTSRCIPDSLIGAFLYCIGQTHCRNLGSMPAPTQPENAPFLSLSLLSDPSQPTPKDRPLQERRARPRPQKDGGSDAKRTPQDRTILVVDDSAFERTVIRAAVEGLTQFRVCGEASGGADGIKKALELKPDLIIMDLAMPDMNGAEAAMVVRNAMPNIPIVLFTLYAEQLRGAISPGFGVTVILSKADGLAPLLECLETLLDR